MRIHCWLICCGKHHTNPTTLWAFLWASHYVKNYKAFYWLEWSHDEQIQLRAHKEPKVVERCITPLPVLPYFLQFSVYSPTSFPHVELSPPHFPQRSRFTPELMMSSQPTDWKYIYKKVRFCYRKIILIVSAMLPAIFTMTSLEVTSFAGSLCDYTYATITLPEGRQIILNFQSIRVVKWSQSSLEIAASQSHHCLATVSSLSRNCLAAVSSISHHCLVTISLMSHQCLVTVSLMSHHSLITFSSLSRNCFVNVSSMSRHCLINVSSMSRHCLINVSSLSHHCLIGCLSWLEEEDVEEGHKMNESSSPDGFLRSSAHRKNDRNKRLTSSFEDEGKALLTICHLSYNWIERYHTYRGLKIIEIIMPSICLTFSHLPYIFPQCTRLGQGG